jgi:hypothetical protein
MGKRCCIFVIVQPEKSIGANRNKNCKVKISVSASYNCDVDICYYIKNLMYVT